mmetsp:Transcript_16500/g.29929  ORF Transcript_16500/g.29929 Transcript_16500/m.29929 type:complete len:135 (+) Transcript_16500:570-974(+)
MLEKNPDRETPFVLAILTSWALSSLRRSARRIKSSNFEYPRWAMNSRISWVRNEHEEVRGMFDCVWDFLAEFFLLRTHSDTMANPSHDTDGWFRFRLILSSVNAWEYGDIQYSTDRDTAIEAWHKVLSDFHYLQ